MENIMSSENKYQAGVCNIGIDEKRKRMNAGYTGSIATILLWIFFIVSGVPRGYRLLTAIPAMIAAVGFIQASMNFCAYFGLSSVFNFDKIGSQTKVEDEHYRSLDRRKAYQIIVYSILSGLLVGLLALVL